MNEERFIENLIEQIKEAQLKLGYAAETIRLYFPVQSMCRLLQMELRNGGELVSLLKKEKKFENNVLGKLTFNLCKDERIEVCISAVGAAYVYEQVPDPPFLKSIIEMFKNNHSLTIDEICKCFAKFGSRYVCEKMESGTDFDYVVYFLDGYPDSWYYCIKVEMGHTIYHRFTETDYHMLIGQES